MWGLSLVSWANFIALLFGVIAVGALYVSATDADKRIAEARARGDEARAEAAKANERANIAAEHAAALEKEAAQAQLKLALLQKQIGPRVIDHDRFLEALKDKRKPAKVFIVWSNTAEDGWYVATQLYALLVESNGPVDHAGPVSVDNSSQFLRDKPGFGPESFGSGIMILFAPNGVDTQDDTGPFVTLVKAIFETLGTSGGEGSDTTLSPGEMRLVIFPRPLRFPRAAGFP